MPDSNTQTLTLSINKYYSFSIYPNPVLGTVYNNAKLISVLDYNTALKFANVELLHRQIYPYLPSGTSSNNTEYTYYLFKHNNKNVVIANVWIITESLVESSERSYVIRLNNISDSQYAIIRDQLKILGISFDLL